MDDYFSFEELAGEKGNGSLVMVVIGFAKEKSQRAHHATHSSIWDNFGGVTNFQSKIFSSSDFPFNFSYTTNF